jgi:hypothetical protein
MGIQAVFKVLSLRRRRRRYRLYPPGRIRCTGSSNDGRSFRGIIRNTRSRGGFISSITRSAVRDYPDEYANTGNFVSIH